MHADDAHAIKTGFFSKIFGHHDEPETSTGEANPNIITPDDASTMAMGADASAADATVTDTPLFDPPVASDDSSATIPPASDDTTPTSPPEAPSDDLQASTMSDVLAVPKGGHEPLDLSSEATSDRAIPDSMSAPVSDATSETITESATPAEDTSDKFELPDIQPASELSHPEVSITLPSDGTEPKVATTTESDEEVSPPSADSAVNSDAPVEPKEEPIVAAQSSADTTPPAPPVAEGEAWKAAQTDATLPTPTTDATPDTTPGPQSTLGDAQGNMDMILAERPDLTTDAKPADVEVLKLTDKPVVVADKAVLPTPATSGPDPEQQAAVVRVEGHLEDLEVSLQKLRDEIAALKK